MRSIILYLFIVFCALMLTPILLVCALYNRPEPLFFLGKHAVAVGEVILGLRIEYKGLHRIKKDHRYIFMPNHLSMLDGPLIFKSIPQNVRVILKQGVFRLPVVGQAMKEAHFIPVDRMGKQGGKRAVQKAVFMIKKKQCLFSYFSGRDSKQRRKTSEIQTGWFFYGYRQPNAYCSYIHHRDL